MPVMCIAEFRPAVPWMPSPRRSHGWCTSACPVINVSLVGPPNVILESVVRLVIARGFIIVAAVGNDGPAAAPLYPASYPGVIGVTAVDAHRHVLVEAARGPQVRFAAPGADMVAAKSPQGLRGRARHLLCGTAGGMSCSPRNFTGPTRLRRRRRSTIWRPRAVDLGARGLDPVYGYGLVAADLGPGYPPGRFASPLTKNK